MGERAHAASADGIAKVAPGDEKMAQLASKQEAMPAPDAIVMCDKKELPVHSMVLQLASPVFHSMLTSGMDECNTKCIKVNADIASFRQFKEFYRLLTPVRGRTIQISATNVDYLLRLSEYYQVVHVKHECERCLDKLPVTVPRLLQASEFDLKRQYRRCVIEIARSYENHSPDSLEAHPKIMLDLLKELRNHCKHMGEQRSHAIRMLKYNSKAGKSDAVMILERNPPVAPLPKLSWSQEPSDDSCDKESEEESEAEGNRSKRKRMNIFGSEDSYDDE